MRGVVMVLAAGAATAAAAPACKNFTDLYGDGEELCESMWGGVVRV